MKKKILFCGEFTGLNTGYSVYWREVISRLYATGKYDIAEFASYIHHRDPRTNNTPWKLFCNLPDPENEEDVARYESSGSNHFGAWRFEKVACAFQPDIVASIRDFWMESFIGFSPYRKCFDWIWMAPCDGQPQDPTWLDVFSTTDRLLTYTDWAREVIEKQAGDHINYGPTASPSAEACFQPVQDKETLKNQLGLGGTKIIGTVMRNQRRKLYPELFKVFREYLDATNEQNTYLYCHTGYPDLGWDMPSLLQEHGIQHRTLFSYRCRICGASHPGVFSQGISSCGNCGNPSVTLTSVNNGIASEDLAKVYNLFDVYVQYANSEGFGMPMVEAAACGIPVLAVDYSAMGEVVRKINGTPIRVKHLLKELETGCHRAVPDNEHLLELLIGFLNQPAPMRMQSSRKVLQGVKEHYQSWDNVAKIWEGEFDQLGNGDSRWNIAPFIREPNMNVPENLSNEDYVKFLMAEVLGEPDRIHTFMATRMLRDLNMGVTTKDGRSMYFNEDSALFTKNRMNEFNRDIAMQHVLRMVEHRNACENYRKMAMEGIQ